MKRTYKFIMTSSNHAFTFRVIFLDTTKYNNQ